MTRSAIVLVVLASVVLAGCAGTQGSGTPTAETPTEDASGVEVEQIPGVSNGTLTNATALVAANGATLVETGGRIRLSQRSVEMETESQFTVGSNGAFTLITTRPSSSGQTMTVDYWSNESVTYVRSQNDGETRYRSLDESPTILNSFNESLQAYLSAGTFTLANDSTGGTTVVFTDDEFSLSDTPTPFGDAESVQGRLVLSQSGQVQNLTITGEVNGQTVSVQYELLQPLIERATQPAWVGEVPESVTLRPELTVDVENNSYLRIEHQGGDAVPANATLTLDANGTSGTATFDTAIDGETRYAYFAADDGSLTVTTEQPSPDQTRSINSPASVSISSGDGVTLHSGSMAWASESASAGDGESGGSESQSDEN